MRRWSAFRRERHIVNRYVPVRTDSAVLAFEHHLKERKAQNHEKTKRIRTSSKHCTNT